MPNEYRLPPDALLTYGDKPVGNPGVLLVPPAEAAAPPPYVPTPAAAGPPKVVRFDFGQAGGQVQLPCLRVLDDGVRLVLVFDAAGYLVVPPPRTPESGQPLVVSAGDREWRVWALPQFSFVDDGRRYVVLFNADAQDAVG